MLRRLPPPAPPNIKNNKKGSGSLPAPRSGYATIFKVCFLLIYSSYNTQIDRNVISSSLYYSGPRHKISSQSVHNFLSNVVHRQTKT